MVWMLLRYPGIPLLICSCQRWRRAFSRCHRHRDATVSFAIRMTKCSASSGNGPQWVSSRSAGSTVRFVALDDVRKNRRFLYGSSPRENASVRYFPWRISYWPVCWFRIPTPSIPVTISFPALPNSLFFFTMERNDAAAYFCADARF